MFCRNDFQFCFEHVRWLRLATLAANSWSGVWQSHRSEAKHPAWTFRLHCQAEYFCASLLAINLIAFKPDVQMFTSGSYVWRGGMVRPAVFYLAEDMSLIWWHLRHHFAGSGSLIATAGTTTRGSFAWHLIWEPKTAISFSVFMLDGKRCFYGSTLQSFCWNCSMIHVNLPKNLHHRESAELDRLQCAGAFPGAAVCFSESPVSGGCMAYTVIILWQIVVVSFELWGLGTVHCCGA